MKVTIKTLQQKIIPIEFEPEQTVLEIKEIISVQKEGVPVVRQKLIHAGRVLEDSKKISETPVREGDFIILMTVNPPTTTPAPVAPINQPPISTGTSLESESSQKLTEKDKGDTNNQLLMGNEYDTAVQGLVNMGFSRTLVIQAMRASFNNPERAVEYLTSGVIPNIDTESNDFSSAERAGEEDEEEEDEAEGEATHRESGKLDFLREDPQFQQLRAVISQNPEMLDLIINQMAQSSPDLIRLVQENRDELRALLLEDGGSVENLDHSDYEMNDNVEDDGNNQVFQVTPDEQAAIDRLGAMGFDPARVVEAFFACERNEEMAANYLLEHLEDD